MNPKGFASDLFGEIISTKEQAIVFIEQVDKTKQSSFWPYRLCVKFS